MKNKLLFLFLCILNFSLAFAQNDAVKGKVTDETGEPIAGAVVAIKGTSVGTTTDADGMYSINAANSTTLRFSFLGYETKEVVVSGRTLNVRLDLNDQQLDDVIVVAYGTASKAGYTGSASTVSKKEIAKSQVSSVSRLLQGAAAGVQSVAVSGQPGSDADIFIRGIGSVNASSTPLYIVDGAPFDGALSSINPADIESINVMKDAAGTALYGSRAANGLIIITTKQGSKRQKAQIDASFKYGVSSRAVADYKQVSTNEYFMLYWDALRNNQLYYNDKSPAEAAAYASSNIVSTLGINPYGTRIPQPVGTDGKIVSGATPLWDDNWSDAYTQDANRTEAQINIGGGGENSTYYISLGYLNDQGIALASDFKRYTGRVNLNADLRKGLRVSANLSLIHSKQNAPQGDDSSTSNTLNTARLIPSFYPIWERDLETGAFLKTADGQRIIDYGPYRPSGAVPKYNHLGTSPFDYNRITRDMASLRTAVEIDIYKGLMYKGSLNIDYTNKNDHDYTNPVYGSGSYNTYPGEITRYNSRTTGFTGNNIITYNRTVNTIHNFKILAGQEFYEYNTAFIEGTRTGLPALGLEEPAAASQLNSFTGFSDNYKLLSFFGNIDYNYNHKYYGSASIRRDGSSRFSPDSRWGTFWSVGGSWRISEEDFMKNIREITKLSIRSSYGGQGNDRINDSSGNEIYYAYQDLFSIKNNLGESGFVKENMSNPNLKWETNLNFNLGVDFGLFDNRLTGSIEYFNRRSKDLLFNIPKALSTGYSGYTANAGALKNVGYEIMITGTPIKTKDLTWTISANVTQYKNEITDLPQDPIITSNKILTKGGSVYDFFLVEWAGVDPTDGLAQWYKTDANGNRVKTKVYNEANTTNSKIVAGSAIPDLVGGFSTSITFRDFDFSTLFAYALGGKIYNQDKIMILNNGRTAGRAMSEEILKRWTPENRDTDVPRMQTSTANAWTSQSTRFLVDGDYLRMKNITLGYNIPTSLLNKAQIGACRLYIQGENLLTVFGEQGLDPEQSVNGVSYFRYPAMKTFSFGMNLSF
ncbi:SusC/RagA family TonB-linked outer membrane protein [Dysgonomonas sp. ZJ279]|uniref:SusC/RagA family TonB-linked outer membrane protein n=1 Tax=Dysgonomonas sp. ZJ279 TaxID=2709796 RepID=UPI0013EB14F4|nr:TonB-dependent receptor [Dysgonomonas sp. ZJ279]